MRGIHLEALALAVLFIVLPEPQPSMAPIGSCQPVVATRDRVCFDILWVACGIEVELHRQHVAADVLHRADGAQRRVAPVELAAPVYQVVLPVDADVGAFRTDRARRQARFMSR